MSVLSLVTGAVMIVLVYGLSFIPTATLARSDDVGMVDDEGAVTDAEGEAPRARGDSGGAAA
ncbi:MAG: hypothetical protein R3D30_07685 [Hyphomicrobiales bacterium]